MALFTPAALVAARYAALSLLDVSNDLPRSTTPGLVGLAGAIRLVDEEHEAKFAKIWAALTDEGANHPGDEWSIGRNSSFVSMILTTYDELVEATTEAVAPFSISKVFLR